MHVETDAEFSINIEEKFPAGKSAIFALQHVLALTGIWIFPVLIGQALQLYTAQVGIIVQACFLTTGIVTILQSSGMLRLPVVQGPTVVFFVVLISGAHIYGLGTAFGSMAVAGVVFALLSLPIRGWGPEAVRSPVIRTLRIVSILARYCCRCSGVNRCQVPMEAATEIVTTARR